MTIGPRLPRGVAFFDAEDFDLDKSTLENGSTKWEIKDDLNALGGKYVIPIGADSKKETELIYQVPEIIGGW